MIPDPMGLGEWYGEDQASQVHQKGPLNFIGFIPTSEGEVRTPETNHHGSRQDSRGPQIPGTSAGADSLQPSNQTSPTDSDSSPKEVTFHDPNEISCGVIKTTVSDHIV